MAVFTPEEAARLIAGRHKLGPEWRPLGIEVNARGNREFVYEATFVRHAIDYLEPLFENTPFGHRLLDEGEPCNDEIVCRGSMQHLRAFAEASVGDESVDRKDGQT